MNEQTYNNGEINNFNNIDNQIYNRNNINNTSHIDSIPFIQKLVFFLTGLSFGLISLTIWFLFKDNQKYYRQLCIIKNGALLGIIAPLIIFIFYFLAGIATFIVATS